MSNTAAQTTLGTTIQRPSWAGEHIGFMPFPVDRM